jgi:hypothetical protein
MGWTTLPHFNQRNDFKAFIADRVRDQDAVSMKTGEVTGKFHCLKHCVRGNILWTVWEITHNDGKSKRFIGCDIIQFYGDNGWGYKDMEESSHPFYYSCPKSYLDMVPVANQEWRDEVMAKHNLYKSIKVGSHVQLTNGQVARIFKKRPMLGVIEGMSYKIPRKMVSSVIEEN